METYNDSQPVTTTVQSYPAQWAFGNKPIPQPIPDVVQTGASANAVNLTASVQ